jgi:hypothetical protein
LTSEPGSNPSILKLSTRPEEFFDSILALSEQAAAGRRIERYFLLDGHVVCLEFAGEALAEPLCRALAHLACEPAVEALRIRAWDSASTGVPWPNLPWFDYEGFVNSRGERIDNLYTPRGDIRGYNTDRIQTHIGDRLFSLLDAERNLGIYWCHDAAELPIYERGAPLRSILHWWLRRRGLQMIHAGAVGNANGAVLLSGKGGSGKSTTALTCLNSPLLYLSDDYSLVNAGPEPYVCSIYNTAKVRPDNLHRVPFLAGALTNRESLEFEKALFFLHEHFPGRLVSRLPLRAVLLPCVTGKPDTWLEPADPAESLASIGLSSLHQLSGSGGALLGTVKRLLASVPSWHLRLGTDLEQIPRVIGALIDGEPVPRAPVRDA